ncbi:MAG: TlpA disulfide reductase family protein [Xanthomonadales bacterium]|nr:TlpA disulfide reductase family protein [Xanthomonadales bacterium]
MNEKQPVAEPRRGRIRSAWRRLRSNYWRALLIDAALILTVFAAVHAWQTRELPLDEAAPETVLPLLDDAAFRSAIRAGEGGIVYFFAPWCGICRVSISNLDKLVADGRVAWATVIALDYEDPAEVRDFIAKTGVALPVLMGTSRTAGDWSIGAFPTYYVIDAEGQIRSRSVGYSTTIGMLIRNWLAK